MFKWTHALVLETDIPTQALWDFTVNPSNWSQWMDQFELFGYEGEIKKETVVRAKVKNSNVFIPIKFTEFNPYNSYELSIKVPFFDQQNRAVLEEIAHGKTRVTVHTVISGWVIPFFGWYFNKKLKVQYPAYAKAIREKFHPHLVDFTF